MGGHSRRRTTAEDSHQSQAERYTREELLYLRWGLVIPGNEILGDILTEALVHLERSAADRVMESCLFAMPGERACYLPADVIRGRSLVLLPSGLLEHSRGEQLRLILHEMAHHVLGHQSPRLESFTQEDYQRQEKEARRLANRWQQEVP